MSPVSEFMNRLPPSAAMCRENSSSSRGPICPEREQAASPFDDSTIRRSRALINSSSSLRARRASCASTFSSRSVIISQAALRRLKSSLGRSGFCRYW